MKEKLNNPISGSSKEQPASGTELDEKGKKEEPLAGKFKSQEAKAKSYEELEQARTKDRQEMSTLREKLAKLEGKLEAQKELEVVKPPVITPEEMKKMEGQFRTDFNESGLRTLYNVNRPLYESIASLRDELKEIRDGRATEKKVERKRELKRLVKEARGEGSEAKEFDELEESIEKELRENKNWTRFENPYLAVFYHLKGKSTRNLAKMTDAERKSFVEGASPVPPKEKKDKKSEYKKRILEAGDDTRL